MMRRAGAATKVRLFCGVMGAFALLAGQAAAQNQLPDGRTATEDSQLGLRLPTASDPAGEPDDAPRARGVAVRDRSRPDYDAVGIPAGGFTFYPELSALAGYDSNVTGGSNGDSDVFGQVSASGRLNSDWAVHALSFAASATQQFYAETSEINRFTYRASAEGRLDVDRAHSLSASVGTQRSAQLRTSISELLPTRDPTIYQVNRGQIGSDNRYGRLRLNVSAQVADYDYKDSVDPIGALIDNAYRDYQLQEVLVGVAHDLGAGREVFVSANYNRRRYDQPASSALRDSDGYEVLVGLSSEITPLIRGRLGIGYLQQDFDNIAFETRTGVAVDVELSYLATELITLNFTGRRYLENISSPTSVGSLTSAYTLGADYEYRRNVILSGEVEYVQGDYIGTAGKAEAYGFTLAGRWLVNRNYALLGQLEARTREVRNATFNGSTDDFVASVGVVFRR